MYKRRYCSTSVLARLALHGAAGAIIRQTIERAKRGDPIATRLCLEYIMPPRHRRSVILAPLRSAIDASEAMARIASGVSCGDLTAREACDLSRMMAVFLKIREAAENEKQAQFFKTLGRVARD